MASPTSNSLSLSKNGPLVALSVIFPVAAIAIITITMRVPYQIESVRLNKEVANAAGAPAEMDTTSGMTQIVVGKEKKQKPKTKSRRKKPNHSQPLSPLQVLPILPLAASPSPPASPVELHVVKPHQNGPESLRSILRKTTRERLFVHPRAWTNTHLAIFRVQGFDLEASLGLVLNRDIHEYPSDAKLYDVLFGENGIQDPMKNFAKQIRAASRGVRVPMDLPVTWICMRYLDKLRTQIRGYPPQIDLDPLSLGHKSQVVLQYDRGRFLHTSVFEVEHMEFDIPAASQRLWIRGTSLHPHMWPIFVIHRKTHPDYMMRRSRRGPQILAHQDWKVQSRDPELVALLLALAQSQWRKMKYGYHKGLKNRCCCDCVCPLVLWIVDTRLYWVRGHIPLTHLRALDDPNFPLINDMKIDMSYPLDMADEADHSKILMSLTAAFDDYFQNVVEDLSLRHHDLSGLRNLRNITRNSHRQPPRNPRIDGRAMTSLDDLATQNNHSKPVEETRGFQECLSPCIKPTFQPEQKQEKQEKDESQAGLA